MADLVNIQARSPAADRRESSNSTQAISFVVAIGLVSMGLIVALYALAVAPGLTPEQVLSIFAVP
jgi:hypothetical protein